MIVKTIEGLGSPKGTGRNGRPLRTGNTLVGKAVEGWKIDGYLPLTGAIPGDGANGGNQTTGILLALTEVDAVVYLVNAFDKVRFAESKKELDDTLLISN